MIDKNEEISLEELLKEFMENAERLSMIAEMKRERRCL
jgi:hypothetical protein